MCTPRGRDMATEDSTEDWNSTANMLRSVLGQVERRLAQSQASPSGSVARGAVQQTSSNSSNPARATQQPSGQNHHPVHEWNLINCLGTNQMSQHQEEGRELESQTGHRQHLQC